MLSVNMKRKKKKKGEETLILYKKKKIIKLKLPPKIILNKNNSYTKHRQELFKQSAKRLKCK